VTLLWPAIALLTLAVLLVLALPLIRNRQNDSAAPARAEYDVALFKDQLSEVERDLERGLLHAEQADAVRTEIQRKLLQAAEDGQTQKSTSRVSGWSRGGPATAIVLILFISTGSVGLYLRLGSPTLQDLPYASRDIQAEEHAQEDRQADQQMQGLLSQLAMRLEKNPNDAEGWLLLGRSLITRRRYDESVAAYKHAMDLRPGSPDITTDYSEALIFANSGKVGDDAHALLQAAYRQSRADPKIRYYIGLYKAQQKDLAGALQEWVNIAAMSSPDAPWMPTIRRQIAAAAKDAGIDIKTVTASDEALEIARSQGIPSAPGPSAADVKAAQDMTPEDRMKMVRSMVERLAERLKDTPDDLPGWKRLANAYTVLGETEKAAQAAARVRQLESSSAPTGSATPGPSSADIKAAQDMAPEDRMKMVRSMVERLAERLKDTPDDLPGWKRLANAYRVLGETEKAADALQHVKALEGK